MNNNSKNSWGRGVAEKLVSGSLAILASLAVCGTVSAQDKARDKDKKDEVTFRLVPLEQFVKCLRANPYEEPKARGNSDSRQAK